MRTIRAAALFFLAGCLLAASPAKKPTSPPAPPLDFSGVWQLDEKESANASPNMSGAVLTVTQKGNRIWIMPRSRPGRSPSVMADEVVADGRAYEKALGPAGKGTVTANWSQDRQSLWIEVSAGEAGDLKKSAVQRSVWKLSEDRNVWVRESISISQGNPRSARLVFRRVPSAPGAVTPSPRPRTRRARTPRPAA